MDDKTKKVIETKVRKIEQGIRDLVRVFEGTDADAEAATKAFQFLNQQLLLAYQRAHTAAQISNREFSLDSTPVKPTHPAPAMTLPAYQPIVFQPSEIDQLIRDVDQAVNLDAAELEEIAETLDLEPTQVFGAPEPAKEKVKEDDLPAAKASNPEPEPTAERIAVIPIEDLKSKKDVIKRAFPNMRAEGRLVGTKEIVLTAAPKEEVVNVIEADEIPDKKHGGIRGAGFIDED